MICDESAKAERRQVARAVRTYMPVCLEVEGRTTVALLRNFSAQGAGLETEGKFLVGQPLRYRWGNERFREGTVAWVKDGLLGIQNDKSYGSVDASPTAYRSVRIPISAPTSFFVDGKRIEGEAINFAQRGMCALLADDIRQGALATIKIGQRYLEGTTAKWVKGNRVGFSLPSAMTVPSMCHLAAGH